MTKCACCGEKRKCRALGSSNVCEPCRRRIWAEADAWRDRMVPGWRELMREEADDGQDQRRTVRPRR